VTDETRNGHAAPHAAIGNENARQADETSAATRAPTAASASIGLTEASLEALLFVAERPLTRREIATLAGVDRDTVDQLLGDLEVSLRERGIQLLVSGDRVELTTSAEGGPLIARYVGADAIRLSPAALETLAIVAYRQPVTKAAIERIRGVDSDYTIRALMHRRLVVELGRADAPGRPFLYGTGFDFLERFAMSSLEELPPLDVDVAARIAEEGGSATQEAVADEAAMHGAGGSGAQESPDERPLVGFPISEAETSRDDG
jgi:segregation and condensation protein B